MTSLLAEISGLAEARLAADAGFDGIVVQAVDAPAIAAAVMVEAGDRLAIGLIDQPNTMDAVLVLTRRGLPARRFGHWRDRMPSGQDLDAARLAGLDGILLDWDGRLLDAVPHPALARLARALTSRGLLFGVAGGLEPPDVPRVLALAPDILLAGAALRRDGRLAGAALALFRDLVPVADAEAWPTTSYRSRDRIFVRDFVLEMGIGAYAGEIGRSQRVCFTVEAAVLDLGRPARDMRDVVSYDLITDTIRDLAAEGHVGFVETLAEAIATRLLAHPRIGSLRVVVEKLDVGPGAVGVEIFRERPRGTTEP